MSAVKTYQPDTEACCPFCGSDNSCGAAGDVPCWCFSISIPQQLLALLPAEKRRKACVCFACVRSFNDDADAFIRRYCQ